MFGFIFVLIMDATRSSADATPANNMTNALIFQAALAGIVMLLSFVYNGTMARSEANTWEQNTLKRLAEMEESSSKAKDNSHLSTSSYPLSTVFGVTLTDSTPSSEGDKPTIWIQDQYQIQKDEVKSQQDLC
jgi:hypothetical protein